MCDFLAPFTLPKSGLRLLVPRVFDGTNASSKDVSREVPIHGQVDDGVGVEVAICIGHGEVVHAIAHDPTSVVELVFQGSKSHGEGSGLVACVTVPLYLCGKCGIAF